MDSSSEPKTLSQFPQAGMETKEKENTVESVPDDVESFCIHGDKESDEDDEYLSAEDDTKEEVTAREMDAQIDLATSANDFDRPDAEYDNQPNENKEDDQEEREKESEVVDDLEKRRQAEDSLSENEKQERKEKAQVLKDSGNSKFRQGDYDDAIEAYTEALEICPLALHKERSIMFANRAACHMKKELFEEAIKDSTKALDLHPHYMKALLRRAELYEKVEKLDEALKDYQTVVELDPSQGMARAACVKLAEQIKDRNEKMKEEMMGKLKDLGNLVLRPFGLSVNNFNLQQDPNSGSYSVQFQQNAPGNGS